MLSSVVRAVIVDIVVGPKKNSTRNLKTLSRDLYNILGIASFASIDLTKYKLVNHIRYTTMAASFIISALANRRVAWIFLAQLSCSHALTPALSLNQEYKSTRNYLVSSPRSELSLAGSATTLS